MRAQARLALLALALAASLTCGRGAVPSTLALGGREYPLQPDAPGAVDLPLGCSTSAAQTLLGIQLWSPPAGTPPGPCVGRLQALEAGPGGRMIAAWGTNQVRGARLPHAWAAWAACPACRGALLQGTGPWRGPGRRGGPCSGCQPPPGGTGGAAPGRWARARSLTGQSLQRAVACAI